MPQPPAQVLESLALLQEAGDLGADLRKIFRWDEGHIGGADLPSLRQGISIAEITERHEGLVPLNGEQESVSRVGCVCE